MRSCQILLAFLAAVLLLPDSVQAQQRRKTKINTIRVGFGSGGDKNALVTDRGLFKAGCWTPVYVFLTAGEQGIKQGELTVETADSDDIPTNYTVPLPALAGGEDYLAMAYTRPGAINPEIVFRIRDKDSNRDLEEKETFSAAHAGDVLFLSVGARLGGLIAGIKPQAEQNIGNQEAFLRAARSSGFIDDIAQLPTQWFGYGSVDLLILTTGNPEFIGNLLNPRENQRQEALGEWVRRGGRLLITIGRNHQVAPELFRRLGLNLPLAVAGPLPGVKRLEAVESFIRDPSKSTPPLVSLPAKDGQVPPIPLAKLVVQKGMEYEQLIPGTGVAESPLMVRMPHGLGQVTVLAFDVDLAPFTSWDGQNRFWQTLTTRLAPAPDPQAAENITYSRRAQPFSADPASQLQTNLEQMPEIPVISFGWVALFIFIYILVVGPLDYFFLKKVVGRLELTWITFPAVVLVVSAAAYFTAYKLKGNDQKVNKIDVVDFDLGGGQVYGTTWFSIFSPRIQHYTIGVEPVSPVWSDATEQAQPPATISWMGRPDDTYGGYGKPRSSGLFRRAYDYEGDASGLRGVPIQVWSSKSFSASWERSLDRKQPPFVIDLKAGGVKSDELTGSITSQLGGKGGEGVKLTNVFLIHHGAVSDSPNVYALGTLTPGVKVAIDRGTKVSRIADWLPAADQSGSATSVLLKKILFGGSVQTKEASSAPLLYLDQGWRTRHRAMAVLVGRIEPNRGSAEAVTANPSTPSRLWLGALPGSGERPGLTGELVQETYLRVWIPLSNPRADND